MIGWIEWRGPIEDNGGWASLRARCYLMQTWPSSLVGSLQKSEQHLSIFHVPGIYVWRKGALFASVLHAGCCGISTWNMTFNIQRENESIHLQLRVQGPGSLNIRTWCGPFYRATLLAKDYMESPISTYLPYLSKTWQYNSSDENRDPLQQARIAV